MTYSNEIKELALNQYFQFKLKWSYIAKIMNINRKTLYNWVHIDQHHKCPNQNAKKYTSEMEAYIIQYVTRTVTFKMRKLLDLFHKHFNFHIKCNTIYYILHKNNITHKRSKNYVITHKRNHNKKVKELKHYVNNIGHDKIISIDESHFELNMKANMGWSKKGTDAENNKSSGNRSSFSLLCAISKEKMIHHKLIKGSVNAQIYKKFIQTINQKTRRKYLLMDNCRIHHAKIFKEYMNNKSNKLLYNVPYSPQTNPIEGIFHVIKSKIIHMITNNFTKLSRHIQNIINDIPREVYQNFYNNSFI